MIHADSVPAFPYTTADADATPDSPRERIATVIAHLTERDRVLPHAFTDVQLQQAIRAAGLTFADTPSREQYRQAILDELDYTWAPDQHRYVPRVVSPLQAVIEDTAVHLATSLPTPRPADIDTSLQAWCHANDLTDHDAPLDVAARQAAFAVLLTATQATAHDRLTPDPDAPTRLIEDCTTQSPPLPDVHAAILQRADPQALAPVIEARHRLAVAPRPAHQIAQLYEAITPTDTRHAHGQYRTPTPIAQLMRAFATHDDPDHLLDLGVGAATLSARPYTAHTLTTGTHDATLLGIDTAPLPARMARTATTLLARAHAIHHADALTIDPDTIDAPVDAVITNPPYVRHQALEPAYKQTLLEQAAEETGLDPSPAASLYAYFLFRLHRFLTAGGRAAILTPAFLRTGYGDSIKQYLLDQFDIHAIMLFDQDGDAVFDDATTSGLVCFLEATPDDTPQTPTRFVHVTDQPRPETLHRAITRDPTTPTTTHRDWGTITTVSQATLTAEQDWHRHLDPPPLDLDSPTLTSLSNLASIHRGPTTGDTGYFCLSASTVEEWNIDTGFLSKLARRSRDLPAYAFNHQAWARLRDDDKDIWLLDTLDAITGLPTDITTASPGDLDDISLPPADTRDLDGLRTYLAHGLSDAVDLPDRRVLQARTTWYQVPTTDPAPILLTPATRGRFRFTRNDIDAQHINTLYGLYPDPTLSTTHVDALLAYLNSDPATELLRWHSRTRQTGLKKLEPNALEDVPVLDVRALSTQTVHALATAFNRLCEPTDDATHQPRQTINRLVRSILDDSA